MKIKKTLVKREIAGQHFLVPVGTAVYTNKGLFALTEVGAFLWEKLADAENEEELVRAVLDEYEVEESIVKKDVEEFLGKLRELEII